MVVVAFRGNYDADICDSVRSIVGRLKTLTMEAVRSVQIMASSADKLECRTLISFFEMHFSRVTNDIHKQTQEVYPIRCNKLAAKTHIIIYIFIYFVNSPKILASIRLS